MAPNYDFPRDTVFKRKPEKILLEMLLWNYVSNARINRLVDVLWGMFPGTDEVSQRWRQEIFQSMTARESLYTDIGCPSLRINKAACQDAGCTYVYKGTPMVREKHVPDNWGPPADGSGA